ncbi:hypothetical protein HZH66_002532 [Vespula vulgaris]|uniref:Uncharacterized protein n=1 Tax=Vespula vulgaris TaxID=7454 RepID=A0A834KJV9_VESVU|nr:hypothetical protein HZH66_002532 [Vespula vulgaris]
MNIFLSRFCTAENSCNRNRNRFIFSREKEHGDPELSKIIPAIDSLLSFSLPPTKHWTRLDEEEQIKKKELVSAMGGALATIPWKLERRRSVKSCMAKVKARTNSGGVFMEDTGHSLRQRRSVQTSPTPYDRFVRGVKEPFRCGEQP